MRFEECHVSSFKRIPPPRQVCLGFTKTFRRHDRRWQHRDPYLRFSDENRSFQDPVQWVEAVIFGESFCYFYGFVVRGAQQLISSFQQGLELFALTLRYQKSLAELLVTAFQHFLKHARGGP